MQAQKDINNVNILFVTGLYPKEDNENIYYESKRMLSNAANSLQWNIIDGLQANAANFDVISVPYLGYFPYEYRKMIIPSKTFRVNCMRKGRQIGFINIKGIETIIKAIRIYNACRRWYFDSSRNRYFIFYSNSAYFMVAIGWLKKNLKNIVITSIITDIPEYDNNVTCMRSIRCRLSTIPRDLMFHITKSHYVDVDCFAVLSKKMNEYINPNNKPSIIMECVISSDSNIIDNREVDFLKGKFNVVYTGTVNKRYGILDLVYSWDKNATDVLLHICGGGDCAQELTAISEQTENIQYYGILRREQVLIMQQMADLLINPRKAEGRYTELSFPSKIAEYLNAGKPVLCYKLGGIPDEYDKVLNYFQFECPFDDVIRLYHLKTDNYDRYVQIGENGKVFIQSKSPKIQVAKLLEMIDTVTNCNAIER